MTRTVRVGTALRNVFDNDTTLVEHLATQLHYGRVVIFLGAGFSAPFGLPTWNDLLKRLFKAKGKKPPKGKTVEEQAEIFRSLYYQNNTEKYLSSVKDALYSKFDGQLSTMRKSETLSAIAALVMNSARGSVSKVITLNWDDLLESYLDFHGYVTSSVTDSRHWNGNSDVTIFHPHGFLPFSDQRDRSADIVFDKMSYSKIIGADHTSWRQEVLSILRTHVCLFIGLSGKDNNLDSMLAAVSESHAVKTDGTPFWGVTFTTSRDEGSEKIWNNRGVHVKVVKDYTSDLPKFLFRILQAAAKKRQIG